MQACLLQEAEQAMRENRKYPPEVIHVDAGRAINLASLLDAPVPAALIDKIMTILLGCVSSIRKQLIALTRH
jgi:hypothetical protein